MIACNLLLLQKYQKDVVATVMKSILKIWLETAKKGETVEFKNNARRIKSPIIIYDLESILVPEKK